MEFGLFVLGGFAILIAMLLAIGRLYPGTGAEQVDRKPARSYEDEIQLELDDFEQMLELQNERRRRRGTPELTEDQVRLEVEAQERERRARSERYRAGRLGPGAAGPG
ncbi:MAG: hypothetical protein WKF33_09805 [Thermoleophilaceae bacterium]